MCLTVEMKNALCQFDRNGRLGFEFERDDYMNPVYNPFPGRRSDIFAPTFPFANSFSNGLLINTGQDSGFDGYIDAFGHYASKSKLRQKFGSISLGYGHLLHPVNGLGLDGQKVTNAIAEDPLFSSVRGSTDKLSVGRLPGNFEPLRCRLPMCNPYVGTVGAGFGIKPQPDFMLEGVYKHEILPKHKLPGLDELPLALRNIIPIGEPHDLKGGLLVESGQVAVNYGQNMSPMNPFTGTKSESEITSPASAQERSRVITSAELEPEFFLPPPLSHNRKQAFVVESIDRRRQRTDFDRLRLPTGRQVESPISAATTPHSVGFTWDYKPQSQYGAQTESSNMDIFETRTTPYHFNTTPRPYGRFQPTMSPPKHKFHRRFDLPQTSTRNQLSRRTASKSNSWADALRQMLAASDTQKATSPRNSGRTRKPQMQRRQETNRRSISRTNPSARRVSQTRRRLRRKRVRTRQPQPLPPFPSFNSSHRRRQRSRVTNRRRIYGRNPLPFRSSEFAQKVPAGRRRYGRRGIGNAGRPAASSRRSRPRQTSQGRNYRPHATTVPRRSIKRRIRTRIGTRTRPITAAGSPRVRQSTSNRRFLVNFRRRTRRPM